MDDLDDDPLLTIKGKSLHETVQNLQRDLSSKETECGFIRESLNSDISKLKQRLQSENREEDGYKKTYKEDSEVKLETAYKQYERNVQYIRSRHQENIQVLQTKHDEELEATINRYEEQIIQTRSQIQELSSLRLSLQNKDDEIQNLQNELITTKKTYDDKVSKLIKDLEDEKLEEEAEKWDLKKYVEIFKKRCLVLETMVQNLERTNSDLKEKVKVTNKDCDVKIAKAKIDYETRQRSMEDEVQKLKEDLEMERQQSARTLMKVNLSMEEERVTHESKMLMLLDQLEEQTKTRILLDAKTAELEEKINVFRDAVTEIKNQYEITSKEIKTETDEKNQEHKEKIEQLVLKIKEVKLQSELKIKEEREQGNKKIEELTNILKKQEWKSTPELCDHEIQTEPFNGEALTVKESITHLKEMIEKYEKEKTEHENTISRLTSEMDEQKECFAKIIELKQQLEVTSVNLESSSESNKKYFKEFIKLTKDFDVSKKHYEIQIQKHHQEIQKYRNGNRDLTKKIDKLKKDNELQTKTCQNIQKSKQELQTVNEEMKLKFSETTKAIDSHMEILKSSIDENKAFYVKTVLQLKQQIEDQIKKRAAVEENAERKLQEALEVERTKLAENFEQLENERNNLVQELQKKNEVIGNLQKNLETPGEPKPITDEDNSREEKLRQHYEKEIQRTDNLILILTKDLEHNNKKYNKLKQLKAQTVFQTEAKINNIKKNYEDKLKMLEKQLEASDNLLDITNINLKQEIEQLLLNIELLEKSKIHVETENKRYQGKIEELTDFCAKLKSDLDDLSSRYEESLKGKLSSDYKIDGVNMADLKSSMESKYDDYIKKLKNDIKEGKIYIEKLIEIKGNLETKLKNYEYKVTTLQKYVSDIFRKCNVQLTKDLLVDDAEIFDKL